MSQPSFALDDAKSRAARCADLAVSARNDRAREYWLSMERLWLQKAEDAKLEAAAEPEVNAVVVEA